MDLMKNITDAWNRVVKKYLDEHPDTPDTVTNLMNDAYDAIAAEINNSKGAILVHTDGYSITYHKFSSKEDAIGAMRLAYNNQNEKDDEWDLLSYILETEAVLYDRGENVYVWKIIEI